VREGRGMPCTNEKMEKQRKRMTHNGGCSPGKKILVGAEDEFVD
jgi:hypothetical protein